MLPFKIAIQLASLRQPFAQALRTAKSLGAEGVEIDARSEVRPADLSGTGLRQIKKALSDLELSVAGVGFRTRRGYDVAEELERRIDATKEVMSMAYALGSSWVVNRIGRVAPETDERGFSLLVQAITDLGRHGQHTGALLAAETGSENGAELAKLIAAVPRGSCSVAFNPGRLIINGFSAGDSLELLSPHVDYVYAQDGVRDLAEGRGLEVQLGRGSADFPALLGRLEEQGFRGWVVVQLSRSEDPLGDIGSAVTYLQSLRQ